MNDSFGNLIPENALVMPHTDITSFRQCRRRWYHESRNGLSLTPRTPDFKLQAGTAWHKAMEALYAPDSKVSAITVFRESMLKQRDWIAARSDIVHEPEWQKEFDEMLAVGDSLLSSYGHQPLWAEGSAPADGAFEVTTVEERMLIPLPYSGEILKVPVYVAVKPDMVIRDSSGKYWTWDHKLVAKTSNVSNPDTLSLDLQMGIQVWALRECMRHHKEGTVAGAIYNMARKQIPGPKVKNPIFGRHEILRSQKELDNLAMQLIVDAGEMIRARSNHFARWHNPQPYLWICQQCKVRTICEGTERGEDTGDMIKAAFVRREMSLEDQLKEEMGE